MRISELHRGRREAPPRKVGIRFDRRADAMSAGVRLYRDFGLDTTIEDATIYVECGPVIAAHYMGIMERATGTPGFNDWESPQQGSRRR